MSTELIIALVVIALVALAVIALLPRLRARQRVLKRDAEIGRRRSTAADMHRGTAEREVREAERLELQARAKRAEAESHGEQAEIHERGLADRDLVRDDEEELAEHVGRRHD